MSARSDAALCARTVRALWSAGVLRPIAPPRLLRAGRAARALGPSAATPVAIGAATDPEGIALFDELGALTWAELDARAQAIAAELIDGFGAGPDRPVAIMCRNHRGFAETLAAAGYAGADALLLNTDFPGPQLAQVLPADGLAAVVLDEEFAPRFDTAGFDGARIHAWADGQSSVPTLSDLAARGRAPATPPASHSSVTILTSGTTGTPKGASRDFPARAVVGPLVTLLEALRLRRGAPLLVGPPLFHGFGLSFLSIGQAVGAPVILQRRFEPARALAAIAEHRAGCFVGVPVMLQRILALEPAERERHDTSSLTAVVAAGAPLPPSVSEPFMDAFGDVLFNAYGTTETGFGALATPADLRAAPGTIGHAPLGTTLRILDAQREPAPAGSTGHIFIGGELVFDGYTGGGNKEMVDGFMNTGDLGHTDAAGRLFVDGREDDMIVSGGENVFPQEVEDTLATHAGVADVAVLGVDDDEFGQRLKAFVVATPGTQPTEDDLIAHVKAHVARYKIPREIVFCAEIPRNPTGKVLRRELV